MIKIKKNGRVKVKVPRYVCSSFTCTSFIFVEFQDSGSLERHPRWLCVSLWHWQSAEWRRNNLGISHLSTLKVW